MTTHFRMVLSIIVVLTLCLGALAERVTVTLRDGRVFKGAVAEETDFKIVIEVPFSGITSKMTFAKRDIESIEREEPEAVEATIPTPADDSGNDLGEDDEDFTDDGSLTASGTGGYVILPATGGVGVELTAGFFDQALNRAVRSGAEAIIITLDSPGGLVSELNKIRDALDDYEDKIKIAFYVDRQAFSAAALLCMSSEHLYVGPRASIGAAVAFSGSVGNYKVDAKFNSAFAAQWRGRAEQAGRPGLLIDAMILPEKEVYADKSAEPWKLTSDKPSRRDDADWEALDNKKEILSLTYATAIGTGAVDGSSDSPHDVASKLELDSDRRASFDGERFAASYYASQGRNIKLVSATIENYVDVIDTLKDAKNARQYRSKLELLNRHIGQVMRLYNKHDYVRNIFVLEGVSIDGFKSAQQQIREILKDL